ncbi:putative baseplate assembly protein [Paenibacillus cymbidii]|uniref:putative baseplate assembly protein n=1 Tax=Paenibacillus cymbidii TaxID=1639034 RepID=UPI0010821A94|nr:putative baseplate assembly protein [Paenibacillus cymbidii]
MLPLPNLDDRTFEQLVKDARRAIPKLLPEWTDENAHDPGITMVEMLAWLTEMQQYYLNRITAHHERKFLKLLGVRQHAAESATADVTFSGVDELTVLPKGTRLIALDQLFETAATTTLLPVKLEKLIVRTEESAGDYTSSNAHAGISYYAFGTEARAGSRLYIGFDSALPAGTDVALSIRLYDGYPVPMAPEEAGEGRRVTSGKVSWKYYSGAGAEAADGGGEGWLPAELVWDETAHLSRSGSVVLRLPAEMKPMLVHPATDRRRYWLACTLEQEGYELAPRIERIALNTVAAVQRETFGEARLFGGSGEAGFAIEFASHWAYHGFVQVQVGNPERGEWRDWRETAELGGCGADDAVYTVSRDPQRKSVVLTFGDGSHGRIPPKGENNVRVVYGKPVFLQSRWLGRANGLPGQTFELNQPGIIASKFLLQIGRTEPGEPDLVWEDWRMAKDFDHSGSYDRHYVYDAAEGTIRFGDNEAGIVPPIGETDNVRIVSLQTGGGQRGNVKAGLIAVIDTYDRKLRELTVTNDFAATGGTEPESLEDAKLRVHQELRDPQRAVTSEDYETIARRTPGLRVARVKAIPLYAPGLRDYPQAQAPAQVTVAVVPYGETAQPQASAGFLESVRRHLDKHRLLTTELHVIPAVYIKITVHAVVVVEPQMKDNTQLVRDELTQLLAPLDGPDGTKGWTFGRSVYKGDIYGAINRVKGVSYVQDLWLDFEGAGARRDAGGDIHLPPHGLVYSGEHEIEFVGKRDV